MASFKGHSLFFGIARSAAEALEFFFSERIHFYNFWVVLWFPFLFYFSFCLRIVERVAPHFRVIAHHRAFMVVLTARLLRGQWCPSRASWISCCPQRPFGLKRLAAEALRQEELCPALGASQLSPHGAGSAVQLGSGLRLTSAAAGLRCHSVTEWVWSSFFWL